MLTEKQNEQSTKYTSTFSAASGAAATIRHKVKYFVLKLFN